MNLLYSLAHSDSVYCVKFSQDGKWLATGCSETANIYDVKTGFRTCILYHGERTYVRSISFSPDGLYLATGADDGQIRIWDITEEQIHNVLKGHDRPVLSIHFSSNVLFSSSRDRTVRIWGLKDGTSKIVTIDDHYSPAWSGVRLVSISKDERFIAVYGWISVVAILEIATGAIVQRLRGHVLHVASTPDGKRQISCSTLDRTLKYWEVSGLGGTAHVSNLSTSPCLMNLTSHDGNYIPTIAVSHDGTWIMSRFSAPDRVLFWDARTGVVQCMLTPGHKAGGVDLSSSPTENLLTTVGEDGSVRIWSYGVVE